MNKCLELENLVLELEKDSTDSQHRHNWYFSQKIIPCVTQCHTLEEYLSSWALSTTKSIPVMVKTTPTSMYTLPNNYIGL